MKDYCFQVKISNTRQSSGDSRKSGDCSSRGQTSEELIILPSFSSQSDDFNCF